MSNPLCTARTTLLVPRWVEQNVCASLLLPRKRDKWCRESQVPAISESGSLKIHNVNNCWSGTSVHYSETSKAVQLELIEVFFLMLAIHPPWSFQSVQKFTVMTNFVCVFSWFQYLCCVRNKPFFCLSTGWWTASSCSCLTESQRTTCTLERVPESKLLAAFWCFFLQINW
jgi:hypothetical protein